MRILITGASGGLGSAVVEQFLSEGHSVAGVARKWPAADSRFAQIAADLSQAADTRRAVQQAGDVDVLVHVLGGFAPGTVQATSEQIWDQMMNVNLRSAFLAFHAVLPGMLERGSGRIIAVGSRVGAEPVAGLAAYGASKAGLVHLVHTLALELKQTAITANIVMPSTIDTPANRAAMPGADYSKWVAPAAIATVISWLASAAAAEVSGAVVPVYGRA